MSRIFLTGMTASQTSLFSNKRTKSYAGQLYHALSELGHEVTWFSANTSYPHRWDDYDAILVGIAPIMSVSANYAYGGLSVIESAWSTGKLTLFIDAPNPAQIAASLASVARNPDQLFKPFFQKRDAYDYASTRGKFRMLRAVDMLANDPWPITLFPALPWQSNYSPYFRDNMPTGSRSSLLGLNMDAIRPTAPRYRADNLRADHWLYDRMSDWVTQQTSTTIFGVSEMKLNRMSNDLTVEDRLSRCIGAYISPNKDKSLWWTPRLMQSLSVCTPIATNWRESSQFAQSWGVLPSIIEDMNTYQRQSLAELQMQDYLDGMLTQDQTLEQLTAALRL